MSKRLREMRLSRARARAEKPAAPDPPATAPDPATAPPAADPELSEKFAKKARDLDAVRKSVEDAASVSAGYWLSYLFVLLYIAIAAGAVTHKDLLLENPVKLPFLNVELPLVAFFVLAPILFIVSHAYTLVHFVMLGAKVGIFDTELRRQLGDAPETREGLRRQLPSNIFVQFLAGPRDIRDGGLGWLLKAIAWITLVIGPVLLLLLIQVQFLPYHLEWVTWVQRFAVLADVILLWALWPAVVDSRSDIKWPPLWHHPGLTLASLVSIGLAFTAATFPGEALDYAGKKQWIPPNHLMALFGATDEKNEPVWTSFHDLLFNGQIDIVTRRRKSLFSSTLVLPTFDALGAAKIDDPKKLDSVKHTLILRGRYLESAVFDSADLRRADLEGAQLQGASLFKAQLQGASLDHAQLQGASLEKAQLQGASLNYAQLQDALLASAQLQGAALNFARLQGASLVEAGLQGASLVEAGLQGASLVRAHLQGALFDSAELQGASVHDAELQGASLASSELQGTDFGISRFAATDMSGTAVWRTNFKDASLTAVFEDGRNESGLAKAVAEIRAASMKLANMKEVPEGKDRKESAITKAVFADLKAAIMKVVPEGENREDALKRIEILNPNISGSKASARETLEKARVDKSAYQKTLADELKSLACSGDADAVHVVRGLERTVTVTRYEAINHDSIITGTGDQAPGLVEAILDPKCPVSADLTEADKAALRELSADEMKELVCSGDNNALNILRGFRNDGHIKETGDQAPGLVEAIVQPEAGEDCPVSAALTEQEKADLRKLAKEASGAP